MKPSDVSQRLIEIDYEKCDGCGICANACHEGAIGIVDGRAVLVNSELCDGIGDCLPACPQGAISFPAASVVTSVTADKAALAMSALEAANETPSQLTQWPVKLRLLREDASALDGHDSLLVCSDCVPAAYGSFHKDLLEGRAIVIACPKFEAGGIEEKLGKLLSLHHYKEVLVVRMGLSCCKPIEDITKRALAASGSDAILRYAEVSVKGTLKLKADDI
jgi:NAD-dependent dihydropyrimidine dehydrogenase PreA subunit